MPRRHVNDESFELSASYTLERMGHSLVMSPGNERRPHRFDKLDELLLAQLTIFELFELN
jgi:hypothetical protein